LNKPDFSQENYLDQILVFDQELREKKSFASIKVYDTFFANYDVFNKNPVGFVHASTQREGSNTKEAYHTHNRDVFITFTNKFDKLIDNLRLPALLDDARLCYPVINVNGESVMVAYQRDFPLPTALDPFSPAELINIVIGVELGLGKSGFFPVNHEDFFQVFHKNPLGPFTDESYRPLNPLCSERFYGVDYDILEVNSGNMVGVPFLKKLPFNSVVSPLH